MITLYIVSSDKGAGKTAMAAALGKRFLGEGKKVGYAKPRLNSSEATDDAAFIKKILGLSESVDSLSPVVTTYDNTAFASASAGKDILIVEGVLNPNSHQIANALDARVIAVESYGKNISPDSYKPFGPNFLGVVVNKAPRSRLKQVKAPAGVNVLGVIPEDRTLLAPTVAELAGFIQGKILTSPKKSGELVENLMVGALSVDSGLIYFGRKSNKAAILRVDRPDMQLAVLETPTRCLVVSGNAPIYHRVVEKAESKGVPIVQTEHSTETILSRVEEALAKARFAEDKKLPRLAEILQQSIDFKILYKGLGLAS
ncbi:MAG: DRTGG domain-containing protein [Dehalococcoidales bacterium]|nr:DRTGG domain-containing protein [Dehalococcoidales bacterium]